MLTSVHNILHRGNMFPPNLVIFRPIIQNSKKYCQTVYSTVYRFYIIGLKKAKLNQNIYTQLSMLTYTSWV